MSDVKLQLNEKGHGAFYMEEAGVRVGEMVISVDKDRMTVYHTEVAPEAEGKGLAKQLLHTMVSYVRANSLQVVPLCPYVLAQFKRHPDEYADIWIK